MKLTKLFLFAVIFLTLSTAVWSEVPEVEADVSYLEEPASPVVKQQTAKGSGFILIKSDTPKVFVYINNQLKGKTPLKISGLVTGTYILKLEKEGYDTIRQTVFASDNAGYTFEFPMKKTRIEE